LEDEKTNIYVNEEYFMHCRFLLVNVSIDEMKNYDNIESIDEATEIMGWREGRQERVKYEIDPDTEFWGHCSNLQAWYEHDYDTRLLHSSLAFPLLKELVYAGDPVAKKVFKEEIIKRFNSGYPSIINYILEHGLLLQLNNEECESLLKQSFMVIRAFPERIIGESLLNLISNLRKPALIEDHFLEILEFIKSLPFEMDMLDCYYRLISNVALVTFLGNKGFLKDLKDKGLIHDFVQASLPVISKVFNFGSLILYTKILEVLDEVGLLKTYYPDLYNLSLRITSHYASKAPNALKLFDQYTFNFFGYESEKRQIKYTPSHRLSKNSEGVYGVYYVLSYQ